MSKRRFGDFELQYRIGRDGPFMVFRARQISLDRAVTLKVLPERTTTLERAALLRREAEAGDKLDHPGVLRVYEAGSVGVQPYGARAAVALRGAVVRAADRIDRGRPRRAGAARRESGRHPRPLRRLGGASQLAVKQELGAKSNKIHANAL